MQVRILPPLPSLVFQSLPPPPLIPREQFAVYSYLLGMYLGDGYLCRMARTYRLDVYLDGRDQHTIDRVSAAINALLPAHRVGLRRHGSAVVVTCYFKGWPQLFPQPGAGPKHARRIVLDGWQHDALALHPETFIGGCIDSDGCRHRRIVRGRNYPAYSFGNRSEDILALFARACDVVGFGWRRANRSTISIARRSDVARLDRLLPHKVSSPERPSRLSTARQVEADQVLLGKKWRRRADSNR